MGGGCIWIKMSGQRVTILTFCSLKNRANVYLKPKFGQQNIHPVYFFKISINLAIFLYHLNLTDHLVLKIFAFFF